MSNFQFCPFYLTIFAVLTSLDQLTSIDCPIRCWHVAVQTLSPELGFLSHFGCEGVVTAAVAIFWRGLTAAAHSGCALRRWNLRQCVKQASMVACAFWLVGAMASFTFCSRVTEPENTMVCKFVVAEPAAVVARIDDAVCCCHGRGVVLVRGSDSSSSIWCRFVSAVSDVVDLLAWRMRYGEDGSCANGGCFVVMVAAAFRWW